MLSQAAEAPVAPVASPASGSRDKSVRLIANMDIDGELVASDHTGRWMQQIGVTDFVALGIERLLEIQGPLMPPA